MTIGDYTSTRVAGLFDVVYLVFNTIGNVTTQDAQVATFQNAAAHLRLGGCFVVETGVPGIAGQPVRGIECFTTVTIITGSTSTTRSHRRCGPATTSAHPTARFGATPCRFRYAWPAELDLMAESRG